MLSQAEEIVALRRAADETKAMVEERFPFVVEVGANDDINEIGKPPRPRSVVDLAALVDRYWSEQSRGFRDDDVRTFRGLYTAVYRRSSALVRLVC